MSIVFTPMLICTNGAIKHGQYPTQKPSLITLRPSSDLRNVSLTDIRSFRLLVCIQ